MELEDIRQKPSLYNSNRLESHIDFQACCDHFYFFIYSLDPLSQAFFSFL